MKEVLFLLFLAPAVIMASSKKPQKGPLAELVQCMKAHDRLQGDKERIAFFYKVLASPKRPSTAARAASGIKMSIAEACKDLTAARVANLAKQRRSQLSRVLKLKQQRTAAIQKQHTAYKAHIDLQGAANTARACVATEIRRKVSDTL